MKDMQELTSALKELGVIVDQGEAKLAAPAQRAIDRFLMRRMLIVASLAVALGGLLGGAIQSAWIGGALHKIVDTAQTVGRAEGRVNSAEREASAAFDRAKDVAEKVRGESHSLSDDLAKRKTEIDTLVAEVAGQLRGILQADDAAKLREAVKSVLSSDPSSLDARFAQSAELVIQTKRITDVDERCKSLEARNQQMLVALGGATKLSQLPGKLDKIDNLDKLSTDCAKLSATQERIASVLGGANIGTSLNLTSGTTSIKIWVEPGRGPALTAKSNAGEITGVHAKIIADPR